MALYCHECGSRDVRASHFRLGDMLYLLGFHYPVRCRECKNRWYAPLRPALDLPRPKRRRVRARSSS